MQAFVRDGYIHVEGAAKDQKQLLEAAKEALAPELGLRPNLFDISARGFGRGKVYDLSFPCAASDCERVSQRITQITGASFV